MCSLPDSALRSVIPTSHYHAESITCMTLQYCMFSLQYGRVFFLPDSANVSPPYGRFFFLPDSAILYVSLPYGRFFSFLTLLYCMFPCHTVVFFPPDSAILYVSLQYGRLILLPDSAILYVSQQCGRVISLPDSAMLLLIELRLLAVRKWLSLSPDTIVCSTFRLCNIKGTVSRDIYFILRPKHFNQ
jgi:hypothetical protein